MRITSRVNIICTDEHEGTIIAGNFPGRIVLGRNGGFTVYDDRGNALPAEQQRRVIEQAGVNITHMPLNPRQNGRTRAQQQGRIDRARARQQGRIDRAAARATARQQRQNDLDRVFREQQRTVQENRRRLAGEARLAVEQSRRLLAQEAHLAAQQSRREAKYFRNRHQ